MKTVKIIVRGQVTGVFFRANTKKTADKLGIKGYVHNQSNDVEIVAKGDEWQITQLLEFCKKGTVLSKVESINVNEFNTQEIFFEFEIRH
jgi:acylphosphatase